MTMRPLPKVLVTDELEEVTLGLGDLLASLAPSDWTKPTVHPDRDVHDLVAHLLDGSLRRLSAQRDAWVGERGDIRSYEDLVAFVQRLNRDFMKAARRLSPEILRKLVADADADLITLFRKLDPDAPAHFGVAWAGDDVSPNWFDVAREYTEKWHHQAQIRDAGGRPAFGGRRHLHPVIATFVRGMPHAYRDVEAAEDTSVQVSVTGDAGGIWCLTRRDGTWQLEAKLRGDAAAEVVLDADAAWRLWTKDTRARAKAEVFGDRALAEPLLGMCCILA
jgi:uncharacterized protein (TIGR03083 family)